MLSTSAVYRRKSTGPSSKRLAAYSYLSSIISELYNAAEDIRDSGLIVDENYLGPACDERLDP